MRNEDPVDEMWKNLIDIDDAEDAQPVLAGATERGQKRLLGFRSTAAGLVRFAAVLLCAVVGLTFAGFAIARRMGIDEKTSRDSVIAARPDRKQVVDRNTGEALKQPPKNESPRADERESFVLLLPPDPPEPIASEAPTVVDPSLVTPVTAPHPQTRGAAKVADTPEGVLAGRGLEKDGLRYSFVEAEQEIRDGLSTIEAIYVTMRRQIDKYIATSQLMSGEQQQIAREKLGKRRIEFLEASERLRPTIEKTDASYDGLRSDPGVKKALEVLSKSGKTTISVGHSRSLTARINGWKAALRDVSFDPAAPDPRTVRRLMSANAIEGHYRREPLENDWHEGTITLEGPEDANGGRTYRWTNRAGASWRLTYVPGSLLLLTGQDNPYNRSGNEPNTACQIVLKQDEAGALLPEVDGFRFGWDDTLHKRIGR